MARQIAFLVATVSLWTGAVAYAVAVWLTNDLSASGLAIIPSAALAAALAWYFEWRREWRQRILSDRRGPDGESQAAAGDA